jgi:hypothetical protein
MEEADKPAPITRIFFIAGRLSYKLSTKPPFGLPGLELSAGKDKHPRVDGEYQKN